MKTTLGEKKTEVEEEGERWKKNLKSFFLLEKSNKTKDRSSLKAKEEATSGWE